MLSQKCNFMFLKDTAVPCSACLALDFLMGILTHQGNLDDCSGSKVNLPFSSGHYLNGQQQPHLFCFPGQSNSEVLYKG